MEEAQGRNMKIRLSRGGAEEGHSVDKRENEED